ncbi:hypothetical protein GCM10027586_15770 [Kineococcus gypseus]|uniref:hypothetical protein n=1 Tax=Kineococcus gypseus TaxID=1637102 RepID=UPI003D7EE786
MSQQNDEPDLGVIQPEIAAPRDRQEHGKVPARPSDDELEMRVEHERREAGLVEEREEVPPATD